MDLLRVGGLVKRIQAPNGRIKSATTLQSRSSPLQTSFPVKYPSLRRSLASSALSQQRILQQLPVRAQNAWGNSTTTKQTSSVSHPSKSERFASLLNLHKANHMTIGAKGVPNSINSTYKRDWIISRSYAFVGSRNGLESRWYCTSKDLPPKEVKETGDGAGLESVTEPEKKVRTEPPKPSLLTMYLQLAKARLGAMVVLSTIFGFFLAPGVPFDAALFASTVIGTSFTVASANSINQYLEVEYDSMMKRTKNRPLPAGHMSMGHALAFGVSTGAIGTIILGTLVNPLCATLAFSNIILYTLVYTPMKRVHPLNTAVGAIVGAIPPLIGWAAQTGGLEAGAWVSFLVMSLWQMPHFHALSWPLRFDYGSAGYRMLANVAPERVPTHVLLYTIAALGLGPFAAFTGLATWHFALLGSIPTLPWIYYAYRFYKQRSNITARQTFKWSLYWLPLFFALLCFNLSPDRDIDTIEEDVIAIHQSQQQQVTNNE